MRFDRMIRYLGSALPAAALLVAAPEAHGTTRYVANNGADATICGFFVLGSSCGSKENPCRSISCAIRYAAPGDTVLVGPGWYGDLDSDGTYGEDNEEFGSAGCNCVVGVNKPVKVYSTDGAAATVIDGLEFSGPQNVRITTDGAEFGKPGGGFTVTASQLGGDGIVIDSTNVTVRGNQVIGKMLGSTAASVGINLLAGSSGILVEANQVMGWNLGISDLSGVGNTIRKNKVSINFKGIDAKGTDEVEGNVAVRNSFGIELSDSASADGNAAYGNLQGLRLQNPFSGGLIEKNNLFGNRNGTDNCGLENSGSSGALAAKNYWGAATGPGPDPADQVCGSATTVTPFSTKPFKVKATIKP